MKIEEYSFGKIKIDGKEYVNDIILSSDGVDSWWKKQSHWVGVGELGDIIEKKPKTVIFGTGYSGIMEVSKDAKEHLEKLGIKVIIETTKKARDTYNELSKEEGILAALHLTC